MGQEREGEKVGSGKWEVRSHDGNTDPLTPYDAVSKIEQSERG